MRAPTLRGVSVLGGAFFRLASIPPPILLHQGVDEVAGHVVLVRGRDDSQSPREAGAAPGPKFLFDPVAPTGMPDRRVMIYTVVKYQLVEITTVIEALTMDSRDFQGFQESRRDAAA